METNQISVIWNEWEIECLLGEGASGKVYKAKRKDIKETYSAIKVIEIPQNESEIREARAEGMEDTEIKEYFKGFVDDLVEEITLLETLKEAKGVVGISDYKVVEKEGKIGWTIYIRMELLTGINDYIKNNKIEENDIINLGIDLCEALEYCERLKIIHRDIKPENIFITKFGEYKLGDFGIARRLENTSSIMSKKGTYLYMPPEVYKGEEYDKTVDIYSLGLVMYKLGNNNRTPFLPPAPNAITYRDKEKALMMRMQGEKIPKPENMTDELYAIIEKMIAYNSKERYKNAKQVKEDLVKLKEKTSKEMTGTVNIFTHKSTQKIEKNKEDIKENVTKEETIIPETELNNKVSQENNIKTKDKESQLQNQKIDEKNKTDENSANKTDKKNKNNKKIIISVIVFLLLLVLVAIGIKLLNKNEETVAVSDNIIMPNLMNLTKEQVEKELEGKELEITYYDTYKEDAQKGTIVYQSIPANTEIEKGSKIVLFINTLEKEQIEKVIMINVVNNNFDEAKQTLENMGLGVENTEEYNDNIEQGKIISQTPNEGEEIEKGTTVKLVVSLGKKPEENKVQTSNQNNTQSPQVQQPSTPQTSTPQPETPSIPSTTEPEPETPENPVEMPSYLIMTGSPGMQVGKQVTFSVIPNEETSISYSVVWSSSNTKVATITQNGLVKAISSGTTTITATCKELDLSRKYILQVSSGSIKGDATGDGVITSADVNQILKLYGNSSSLTAEKRKLIDMDDNGAINATDAALLSDAIRYGY